MPALQKGKEMELDDKMSKDILIDKNLNSYRELNDKGWKLEISLASQGTVIDRIVFDFQLAVQGCVNTFVMPYLTVKQMEGFANAFSAGHEPFMMRYIGHVYKNLTDKIHFTKDKKDRIEQELHKLYVSADLTTKYIKKNSIERLEHEEYWDHLVNLSPFRTSLWGSQRLCYGGLYYAYEDFVLRIYRLKTGESKYRIENNFAKLLREAFSESIRDDCWTDTAVFAAREVRHALVHAGGRETLKLKNIKHGISVHDGELQILPDDTRSLYVLLTKKSLAFVKGVLPFLPVNATENEEPEDSGN